MSGETIDSLLEFLRISARVSVVQLEPKRAREFAEVLARLVTEKGIADRAAAHWEGVAAANALDVATEVAKEREACALTLDEKSETWRRVHGPYWGDSLKVLADQLRARGGK